MGYEDNQFIEAFRRNVKLQNQAAVEDSAIAQTIISFMEDKEMWQGTPTELLGLLETVASTLSINTKNHKIWPSKPNVLSRRLKYVISNLKEFGINIRPGDNSTTKNKTLCIKKIVVQSSILPIHRYDIQDHAQISSDISIDMNNSIDSSIDTHQIPIPENLQIRAQNGSGIDSIDILQCNRLQTGLDLQPQDQKECSILLESIYRLGHSDTWACYNCRQRGDKWFMQKHHCKEGRSEPHHS